MHNMLQLCIAESHFSILIKELDTRRSTSVVSMLNAMRHRLSHVFCQFTSFLQSKGNNDPNWKVWNDYVLLNAFSYIALFSSIRSGNWDLRLASIKLMAPVFSAFDRPTYRKLVPQHLADCLLLPSALQDMFSRGGFVVSITGRCWHSIGLDEAHEVNGDCKMAVVHPNKEFISRMALYFPLVSQASRIFPRVCMHV